MKANWTLIAISAILLVATILGPEQERQSMEQPESEEEDYFYPDDVDDPDQGEPRGLPSRKMYSGGTTKKPRTSKMGWGMDRLMAYVHKLSNLFKSKMKKK
ncbi:uncharacterized protein TRIADDRAFT_56104 [Trichoplax adhaerens]|uniref:Uncharacterized protein n=1 Tax=Trichoplax adhaerens TaxID=10228 RepID=B3RTZ9_TRIAD|nr:predicted protein [Trichoplax adhaerens]EDV25714.1 predicted protein [Trichoplax adhaerens]|eukprot:XP_002111747.1 predicted protein [Trichoplax adhaerens]